MNKRLEYILELYSNHFTIKPLKTSGAFSLVTEDNVYCGVFNTQEDAIKAMPVMWYNKHRGYVPERLCRKAPFKGKQQNNRR